MAKKKKKVKLEKIKESKTDTKLMSIFIKVLRIIAIIFSSLLIYSLFVKNQSLIQDFDKIVATAKAENIWAIFGRGIEFINPVGPLGVIIAFSFSYILGHYLTAVLALGVIIKNLIALFGNKNSELRHNITLFMGFFFFLQLLMTNFYLAAPDVQNGMVSIIINTLLITLIGIKGARAFFIIVLILDILLIFGWDPVKTTFIAVGKTIIYPFYHNWKNDDSDDLALNKDRRVSPDDFQVTMAKTPVVATDIAINNHKDRRKTIDSLNEEAPTADSDNLIKSGANESHFQINQQEKSNLVAYKKNRTEAVMSDSGTAEKFIKPDINKFLTIGKSVTDCDKNETEANIKRTSGVLKDKLAEFGIEAEVVNVNIGPIITQYELKPAPGVKVNRFNSYADDLSLALKAASIRIQAPIPGRGLVGIEIPNKQRDIIYLKEILLSEEMKNNDNTLTIGLGKDISGRAVVADLAKMPHLLIAGATGSGKSVCINTIIMSLLFRTTPEEVRLILIDPKRVELAGYGNVPHLWTDVVTDPEESLETFKWAVDEMERRYGQMQELGVRDRESFNKKVAKTNSKLKTGEEAEHQLMPYIVIIVDEFADLIMTAGKEIELPITRLAQMARAVGMHLVLATQRPSIKVITGIIKANFPARIAFQVSSRVDSRVILDEMGAEKLLGKGDMLFVPPGTSRIQRIHGAFVADNEINQVIDYLETQPKPAFRMEKIVTDPDDMEAFEYDDELFIDAARLVISSDVASVSMLQRSFKIGYARAGRLIDMLEQANIVGPHQGSKSREVTATVEDLKIYGIDEE